MEWPAPDASGMSPPAGARERGVVKRSQRPVVGLGGINKKKIPSEGSGDAVASVVWERNGPDYCRVAVRERASLGAEAGPAIGVAGGQTNSHVESTCGRFPWPRVGPAGRSVGRSVGRSAAVRSSRPVRRLFAQFSAPKSV